jgi:hypothetical protein
MGIEYLQERMCTRLIRESGCVVLRAEARWWERIEAEEEDLFSGMYRQAAEAFMTWAEQIVGEVAKEDYRQSGQGAAHRFKRYGCRYDMEISPEESDGKALSVIVTATVTRVGQSTPIARETRRFVWNKHPTKGTPVTIRPEARRLLGKIIGQKTQKV